MLYAQIIAFILVMILFEAYTPSLPTFGPLECLFATVAAIAWLGGMGRLMVRRLVNRMRLGHAMDAAKLAGRLKAQLQGGAIGIFALCVIYLDLKFYLMHWIPVGGSETLSGLLGLCFYAIILSVTWWSAYPLEKAVSRRAESAGELIISQLRLCAPVVFPWLMVALVSDIIRHAIPGGGEFLASEAGEWFVLVGFFLIMGLFFPPLVRYWWGCKPLEFGETRRVAREVLTLTNVKVAEILTWPLWGGKALTAGILGVVARWRYLLITPSLAQALTPNEMAAVVAHEAGHVRHKHIPLYICLFTGFFLAVFSLGGPLRTLISYLIMQMAGTGWGAAWLTGESGGGDGGLAGVILALPMLLALVLYIRFVLGWFMRNFERQADFFALRTMGTGQHIIGSLESIGVLSGGTREVPSWHHFSIAQRVDALNAADLDYRVMKKHDRKLRRGLAAYLALLALVVGLGWGLDLSRVDDELSRHTLLSLLENRVEAEPENLELRLNLGILNMEMGREKQGLAILAKTLKAAPREPEVLNALAWSLCTAKDKTLRRPDEALRLARLAVSLKPVPHIWDTLAEAYYVHGDPEKAYLAAEAALRAGPKERLDYYHDQLRRFGKAMNEAGRS